ncbi:MAG: hypothetical protein ACFFDW_17180 [Candidatus Thorarchaeota archaeon]
MAQNFWLWLKYFVMKWRFRLDQARAIFGLLTFAMLLAVGYIDYISFLKHLGFWGVMIFSAFIFLVFLVGGYLYDRVLRLWSETNVVNIERNPYTWVPGPKEEILWLGLWSYLFSAIHQMATEMGIELKDEEKIRTHLKQYFSLGPSTTNFEVEAKKVGKLSNILMQNFLETGKVPEIETLIGTVSKEELDELFDHDKEK